MIHGLVAGISIGAGIGGGAKSAGRVVISSLRSLRRTSAYAFTFSAAREEMLSGEASLPSSALEGAWEAGGGSLRCMADEAGLAGLKTGAVGGDCKYQSPKTRDPNSKIAAKCRGGERPIIFMERI